ncbi:MAG: DNRLRE domain-containing protein, partial [Bacteroidetes bacterium]|nr:DNRLRE domain-containing protein [Bacteroidota bacterium]
PSMTTNIVRGFDSFEAFPDSILPFLEIISVNGAGTVRDTSTYNLGVDTFVGNIDNLNTDPGLLHAQSGVVYRSTLHFDVSFIPRGAIINKADMLLSLDPGTTLLTKFTADTVVSSHVILDAADNSVYEPDRPSAYGRPKEGTSTVFSFSVPHAVQFWLMGNNYGILLRPTTGPETATFDLYTFSSHTAADSSQRPRMQILYSTEEDR